MGKRGRTCKLCNKNFSTSRGLGGHMKSHGGANSSAANAEKKLKINKVDFEGDGYGLRVNPKKSWKLSCSKVEALYEKEDEYVCNCKVCGKRFDSLKAMFGHMRHHSSRERKETMQTCKNCGKGFDSLRALTAHCKSHSRKRPRPSDEDESESILEENLFGDCGGCIGESMRLIRRKRSKRLRYKISTQSCSFDSMNESKFVTEFGQEVVEGAICLMIISVGGGNWGRISSVTESSDNNSMSVEVQSPGLKNRAMGNKVGISVCGDIGSMKINVKVEKLVDCISDSKNVCHEKMCEFSEIDSGFSSDGEKITKSRVPIYKSKVDEESAFILDDAEIEKESHGVVEMDLDIVDKVEFDVAESGFMKSGLNKKSGFKACNSGKHMTDATESEVFADSQKKREHRCRTCGKVFGSHQALGGHQRVHYKDKFGSVVKKIEESEDKIQMDKVSKIDYSCKLAELEYSDNSMEQEMEGATLTGCDTKGYMCNICLKVFAKSRALGGHKRVHYGKESEVSTEQTIDLKQQISDFCGAFDLTRPVRIEEENGDVEFKSWLLGSEVRSDCIHDSFQVSNGIC